MMAPFVILAKAGISCREGQLFHCKTPACAGVTGFVA